MAFAEKRGPQWRVRFRQPDGTQRSHSGFTSRSHALAYGDRAERIQRPRIELADWAATWMPAAECSDRIRKDRVRLLALLFPQWGTTFLDDFDAAGVTDWARRQELSPYTVNKAVALLSTMLTAAVEHRHITVNPLLGAWRPLPTPRRSTGEGTEDSHGVR